MKREKFIASTELKEPTAKRKYGYCSYEKFTLNSSTTDVTITNRSMDIKVFSQSNKNPASINVSLNLRTLKNNMFEKLKEKAVFRRKTV